MKVRVESKPIGQGSMLFHIAVYGPDDSGEHGHMYLVAANNIATALYTAWAQHHDDMPLDLDRCDGYLIGTIEESL